MNFKHTAFAMASLAVSACASSTDEIGAAYVSPLAYQGFTCSQLSAEAARLGRKASDLTYSINKNASNDSAAMGAGLILFWPALFFIDGDSPQTQEYARLKGEYEAVEQAAIRKDCAVDSANPFTEAEKQYREQQERMREQNRNRRVHR